MACAIYTPSRLSSFSSSKIKKSTILSTLNPNSPHFTFTLPSNLLHFTQWSGLKQLSISISTQSVKRETKDKCKGVVFASLFGVGAPEALVIGVVALLVFGPKGLAEVARNLGKTLREFQPTIRELQAVSNEFKSTLEREIGLDEIPTARRDPLSSNPPPNITQNPPLNPKDESDGSSSPDRAYSTEDYLKITEEQLKAPASQQQEQEPKDQTATSGGQVPLESSSQPQDTVEEAVAAIPTTQKLENET